MPIQRPPNPEEAAWYQQQGIDPKTVMLTVDEPSNEPSIPQTIGRTLAAHGGSLAGGGIGSIGGGALVGLAGGGPVGSLIGAIGAGLAGSYGGGKAQAAIQGPDLTARLEQEQEEAAKAHPFIAGATDVTAGALASGGAFNPRGLLQGGKSLISSLAGKGALNAADQAALQMGLRGAMSEGGQELLAGKEALRNVLKQSGINTGIGIGTDLATGNPITAKGIAENAIGGALFSSQSRLGRRFGGHAEPQEPTAKVEGDYTIDKNWNPEGGMVPPAPINAPKENVSSWTAKDEQGNHLKDNKAVTQEFSAMVKPDLSGIDQSMVGIARTKVRSLERLPVEQKREMLHQAEMKQLAETAAVEKPEGGAITIDKNNAANAETILQEEANKNGLLGMHENPAPAVDKDAATIAKTMKDKLWENTTEQPTAKKDAELRAMEEERMKQQQAQILASRQPNPPEPESPKTIVTEKTPILGGMLKDNLNRPEQRPLNPETGKSYAPPSPSSNAGGEHIPLGKTVGEDLANIAKSNHPIAALAREIKIDPESAAVSVGLHNENTSSYYSSHTDSILHSQDQVKSGYVRLHEIIHAATMNKLNHFDLNNPHIKELSDCFDEARGLYKSGSIPKDTFGSRPYGLTDIHEFVAEALSSKSFQKTLNEIQTQGQSLWSRLVNAVRNLLGVDVKHGSMLERVLHPIDELMQQERPNSSKEVASKPGEKSFAPSTKKEDLLPTSYLGNTGHAFRAALDTIRETTHPLARNLADSLQHVFESAKKTLGTQWNPMVDVREKYHLGARDEAVVEKVVRERRENATRRANGSSEPAFNANAYRMSVGQRALLNQHDASLLLNGQEAIKNGEPVSTPSGPRKRILDPNYTPTTSNPKVTDTLKNNVDQKTIQGYHDLFTKYQVNKLGVKPDVAEKNWKEYLSHVQGSIQQVGGSANATYFNAARKQMGLMLPPEMTRPGFMNNMEAYFRAQSTDNAYYKHIETNKEAMQALGYTTDPWGNKIEEHPTGKLVGNTAVENVMDEVRGEVVRGVQGQMIKKGESLATSALLGPLTETHVVLSNWAKQLTYCSSVRQAAASVTAAVSHWGEGLTHAKENGVIVGSARNYTDLWNSNLTGADRFGALSKMLRNIYTLGGLTEKVGVGSLQAMNEALIPFKIQEAAKGDRTAQRLMQHLDPEWRPNKTYSQAEKQALASNLTGVIHGTRDARTMPSYMLHDNEISAFLKLSSWSIAQTNSFMRDVWTPATEGNPGPLLRATLGAAVGGYIIKEAREMIGGKKSQIPSLTDIASSSRGFSGNIPALAYNAMAASQFAGFGGMYSQVLRWPFDAAFRNSPQGATFPLDEVVSDIANTGMKAAEAIFNDKNLNWGTLAGEVSMHLMTHDLQLGRVAFNHAVDLGAITGYPAEKKELADKLNQVRRFKLVEGIPANDAGSGELSFMDLEGKHFKMEQDPQKAMQMIPSLVSHIITGYGNNPDVMLEKLKALKSNSYATFPSMEDTPISFMKYISFLQREHGPEKAQEALSDYLKHKVINEAKGSVVP